MSADNEAMIDEWFRSDDFVAALSYYIAERRAANRRQREWWDREAAEIRALNAALREWFDPEATAYFTRMMEAEKERRVVWRERRWVRPRVWTGLSRDAMTTDAFLARLERVKPIGPDRWKAQCPAHEDRHPSLSITRTRDRLLVHCYAGCHIDSVLGAIRARRRDLFPRELAT